MAKARILRKSDKPYLELPQEFAEYDEIELFQLKEGYYLLSVPLGQGAAARARQAGQITDQERDVLRKLLSIRFENRTPAFVGKALEQRELEILRELERRRLVNVFRGDKYREGVYNINDKIYPLLSGRAEARAESRPEGRIEARSQEAPPSHSASPGVSLSALNSRGFAIITDKREALALSEQLSSEIKGGSVVGIKGFDGKFYLVTKNYLTDSAAAISSVLKEEMDVAAISSAARLEPDGCVAVLRLLAENGEIIEKKRGVFAPV